jgi:hypothetical protein
MKKMALRVWLAVAVAAVLVTMSSPNQAMAGTDDSSLSLKDLACKTVGCPGGSRACAEVEGKVEVKEIGSVSVTWHCYEGGSGSGGGEYEM